MLYYGRSKKYDSQTTDLYIMGLGWAVCSRGLKNVMKFLKMPLLNTVFDDMFSAIHTCPLIFSFLTTEYSVDHLNSNVCVFEINEFQSGVCLLTPHVIATFMSPELQHHCSHFITYV